MVIYSVDNRESFTRAAQILYRLYDHRRNTPLPLILVGNKVDLQRKRKVSHIEGKMLSKIYKCSFVEVSALLSMNMESVWSETLKKLQNNKAEKERLIEKRRQSIMGRLVRQGRLFAKSCEEIIARLYINHL
jgi:GTPase SAR1 family protein